MPKLRRTTSRKQKSLLERMPHPLPSQRRELLPTWYGWTHELSTSCDNGARLSTLALRCSSLQPQSFLRVADGSGSLQEEKEASKFSEMRGGGAYAESWTGKWAHLQASLTATLPSHVGLYMCSLFVQGVTACIISYKKLPKCTCLITGLAWRWQWNSMGCVADHCIITGNNSLLIHAKFMPATASLS